MTTREVPWQVQLHKLASFALATSWCAQHRVRLPLCHCKHRHHMRLPRAASQAHTVRAASRAPVQPRLRPLLAKWALVPPVL